MDINELILSDAELEVIDNGTWVGDFVEAPGLELLVCGLKSKEAQKSLEAKQARLRQKNRGRPLTNAQLAETMQETLAEVILKGWRGLKSNGEDFPYSKEQATNWIMSRNGDKFAGLVLQAAQRVDEQASDYVDAVKKS